MGGRNTATFWLGNIREGSKWEIRCRWSITVKWILGNFWECELNWTYNVYSVLGICGNSNKPSCSVTLRDSLTTNQPIWEYCVWQMLLDNFKEEVYHATLTFMCHCHNFHGLGISGLFCSIRIVYVESISSLGIRPFLFLPVCSLTFFLVFCCHPFYVFPPFILIM